MSSDVCQTDNKILQYVEPQRVTFAIKSACFKETQERVTQIHLLYLW